MKPSIFWSLFLLSSGAFANWEVIERKDSMTDVKSVQAFSGEQHSTNDARPGALFFDCVPKAGGFSSHVVGFTLFAQLFPFTDSDKAMMRVDTHKPISTDGIIRAKPWSDNRTLLMFLDATKRKSQDFVSQARKGSMLAVRVVRDGGRSIEYKVPLNGSDSAFGVVLEHCGLPTDYPKGYSAP